MGEPRQPRRDRRPHPPRPAIAPGLEQLGYLLVFGLDQLLERRGRAGRTCRSPRAAGRTAMMSASRSVGRSGKVAASRTGRRCPLRRVLDHRGEHLLLVADLVVDRSARETPASAAIMSMLAPANPFAGEHPLAASRISARFGNRPRCVASGRVNSVTSVMADKIVGVDYLDKSVQ